jgi:hypothetical protein
LNIHREANATLLGDKLLVVYDGIKKKPTLYPTSGRHNAQIMIVEGKDNPAFAKIDIKYRYIKEGRN